jgi:hypothetical protein
MAEKELRAWQREMIRAPSIFTRLSARMQEKMNSILPEKLHQTLTVIIRQMVRGVLFGARYTTRKPVLQLSLEETEDAVGKLVKKYQHTAAAEGGITGAGGLLLGLADFPLLLGIKIKMLFDIAALYGFNVKDYRERIYLLHIFQLAFSSQEHRREVFRHLENWEEEKKSLPEDITQFEWRKFQQEYRDYIDLAKMAQLVPGIGAVVGVVVNYRLIKKLAVTAMNAYRMRVLG